MLIPRVIPCLLLAGNALTKTKRFRQRRYVGDVVNAVRIFNDKQADELLILDIDAARERRGPRLDLIRSIASECFMPLGYGGGVSSVQHADALFDAGIEKVALNSAAARNPGLLGEIATKFGSQSVVACLDCGKDWLGRARTYSDGGRKSTGLTPVQHARAMQESGAGEIIVNSIARDGMRIGYDLALIREIAAATSVPLVACGGAGELEDFRKAVDSGASAAAAGSFFVFHGRHQAVLITYPERHELESLFSQRS